MIVSNYENDIVFARFLVYVKKALSHIKINYKNKLYLCERNEVMVDNEKMEYVCDSSVTYNVYDELSIFDLSSNPDYINKINLETAKLSQKQRMVIDYYYFKNMTNKEIAQKMHITECAIEKLKTRAFKKLRKNFTEEIKNEME